LKQNQYITGVVIQYVFYIVKSISNSEMNHTFFLYYCRENPQWFTIFFDDSIFWLRLYPKIGNYCSHFIICISYHFVVLSSILRRLLDILELCFRF